jgi:hypothetical protein
MVLYGTLTQAFCGTSSLRFVIPTAAKDLLFTRVGIGLQPSHVVSIKPVSRDGVANVLETLAVYKAVNTVSARESRRGRRPRLPGGAKLRRILPSGTRARAPAPDKHERLAAGLMLPSCSHTRHQEVVADADLKHSGFTCHDSKSSSAVGKSRSFAAHIIFGHDRTVFRDCLNGAVMRINPPPKNLCTSPRSPQSLSAENPASA